MMNRPKTIASLNKRERARYLAACARYQADKQKPPTRSQAQAWLAPIRKAFNEMRGGEVDSVRGYAITRIHRKDEDYARVDHCINGFLALFDRLAPGFDTSAMRKVSKKLEHGVLIEYHEVDACFVTLNACEDLLLTFKRATLIDAANTESINIELELLGLKEVA